ncbi:MAG: hypothetical protein R3A48_25640 [Polyangiales bacterium]
MNLHRVFAPTRSPAYSVFAHAGGVLLLPSIHGADVAPAYWSETGEAFADAPIDLSAIQLGPNPHLRPDPNGVVTPQGFVLCDGAYGVHLASMSVGPAVRFAPTPFAPPPESLTRQDLMVDAAGTWWLSGYARGDERQGRVYSSPDGRSWTLAVHEKHMVLTRILPRGERLIGLQYKQISELTPGGLVKLGAARGHLSEAVFTTDSTVTFGEGSIGVLLDGAEKARHTPSPVARPRLLATSRGVLLGGAEGLFHSVNGLKWAQVSDKPVMALVASKAGPLVVTTSAEVWSMRD